MHRITASRDQVDAPTNRQIPIRWICGSLYLRSTRGARSHGMRLLAPRRRMPRS